MSRLLYFVILSFAGSLADANGLETKEPSHAALEFCQVLQKGGEKLKLEHETAISPAVEKPKLTQIRRRLERVAMDLSGKEFLVDSEQIDGDLAAVLIQVLEPWEPSDAQLLGLAVVRNGGEWKPTPIPGSFENAMIPATSEIRKRAKRLEDWVLRKQSGGLQDLIDREWQKMRDRLERELPVESLVPLRPETIVETFFEAASKENREAMLALCVPETEYHGIKPWVAEDSKVVDWHWVFDPATLRVHFETRSIDKTEVLVHFGMYRIRLADDRATKPIMHAMEFRLRKTGTADPWRLVPPEISDEEPIWIEITPSIQERINTSMLQMATKEREVSNTSEAMLLEALTDRSPLKFLGLMNHREGSAGQQVVDALAVWSGLAGPVPPMVMNRFETEKHKAWSLFRFNPRRPNACNPVFICVSLQDEIRWGFVGFDETPPQVRQWFLERTTAAETERNALFLKDVAIVRADDLSAAAPSDSQVKEALERWHESLRVGDLPALLGQTAMLSGDSPGPRLCEGLATAFRDLEGTGSHPELRAIHSYPPFSSAVVDYQSETGKNRSRLLVFSNISNGVRILPEINLVLDGGRSADFLNRIQIREIETFSEQAAASITSMIHAESRMKAK